MPKKLFCRAESLIRASFGNRIGGVHWPDNALLKKLHVHSCNQNLSGPDFMHGPPNYFNKGRKSFLHLLFFVINVYLWAQFAIFDTQEVGSFISATNIWSLEGSLTKLRQITPNFKHLNPFTANFIIYKNSFGHTKKCMSDFSIMS